jgi:plastocyanin
VLNVILLLPLILDGGIMKLVPIIILAAVLTLSTGIATADTAHVLIRHFQFQPDTVTIKKGDTVTWTHPGTVAHTVKFADSESPVLTNGASYSKTFNQTGTFHYECGIHPQMKGTVIVK